MSEIPDEVMDRWAEAAKRCFPVEQLALQNEDGSISRMSPEDRNLIGKPLPPVEIPEELTGELKLYDIGEGWPKPILRIGGA